MTKISDEEALTQQFRKHAATIHITGDLGITERKLANVLFLNAIPTLGKVGPDGKALRHSIPVSMLIAMVWRAGNNDALLKESLTKLSQTGVQYNRLNNAGKTIKWGNFPLVVDPVIEGGIASYEYGSQLTAALLNPEFYAVINMGIQRQFTSQYALALYENCLRFRKKPGKPGSGSTGDIEVGTWRELLNATAPLYQEFRHFNTFVIQKAVKEINAHSDISVEPHLTRAGRKVTHIRFSVIDNPQFQLNLGSPEDDEIRNGDLFRRVVALGCSEELALSMIRKDATKVAEGVRITEANLGKVKISAAKYLEGTIANLPDTPPPAPEPEPTPVLIEVSIEDSKKRSLVRELTAEEKARLADEFITANKPASRFNVFRDSFAEATDQLNYRQYQRERAADVIANRG